MNTFKENLIAIIIVISTSYYNYISDTLNLILASLIAAFAASFRANETSDPRDKLQFETDYYSWEHDPMLYS